MKREPAFKTEVDLCAAFIPWAAKYGWVSYAETAGWDILLAHADGTQIGIQAKLRLNVAVLDQAIDDDWASWRRVGPDFRAVLVPEAGSSNICAALGLTLFRPRLTFGSPMLFDPDLGHHSWRPWHYWNPLERHPLPSHIPDVAAGASGPAQLTEWKIKALRICAILELRGYVTKQDFRLQSMDARRWTSPDGWLKPKESAPGQFVAASDLGFARQHPIVYPKIREEMREQLAKAPVEIGGLF